MNRRQVLGTVGVASLAGCLDSVPGLSQCSDAYEWCHPVPGDVYAASHGLVFGIEAVSAERSDIDTGGLFSPEPSGSVFALDTETGDEQWTYGDSSKYEVYTRLHAEDAIYIEWMNDHFGGELHALGFDGERQWETRHGSVTSLQITTDVLYLGDGDFQPSILAFHKTTGDRRWEYNLFEERDWEEYSSPSLTLIDDRLYVGGEELLAVDASDHSILWTYGSEYERVRVSAIVDGVAFVETDSGVAAVADGEEQWTETVDGERPFSIITVTSDAVIARRRADGVVHAFDVETGEVQWTSAPTLSGSRLRTAHSETTAYVADDQSVVAIDITTGDHEWEKELNHHQLMDLVLWVPDENTEDSLYISTNETHLEHLNTAGETTWEHTFDGAIRGRGVLIDDLIVIGTNTGIFALKQP